MLLFRDAAFTLLPGFASDGQSLSFVNATLNIPQDLSIASLHLEGGGIYGAGDLTISDSFEWLYGTLGIGGGKLKVASTATMTLTGGSYKFIDRVLENAGTLIYNGNNLLFNQQPNANGRIENLPGGLFIAEGDGDITFANRGVNAINNAGAFVRRGDGTTTISNLPLHNTGSIVIESGTLQPLSGFTQAGVLAGSGTLATNCVNAGIIRPDVAASALTISGDLINTADGRIELTLAAPDADGNHVGLRVTGCASLGGNLAVSLAPPFVAAAADTFPVLTFGTRSGDFSAVEGLLANHGYDFSRSFSDNALILTVLVAGDATAAPSLQARLAAIASGAAGADSDGDGVSDLLELAFGSNPADPASVRRSVFVPVAIDGVSFPALRWWQRSDLPAIAYALEYSRDLTHWLPADGQQGHLGSTEAGRQSVDEFCDEVLTRLNAPIDRSPMFLRLNVNLAQP